MPKRRKVRTALTAAAERSRQVRPLSCQHCIQERTQCQWRRPGVSLLVDSSTASVTSLAAKSRAK
eukprot:4862347-Prorocentrum_lima.AAC.1